MIHLMHSKQDLAYFFAQYFFQIQVFLNKNNILHVFFKFFLVGRKIKDKTARG